MMLLLAQSYPSRRQSIVHQPPLTRSISQPPPQQHDARSSLTDSIDSTTIAPSLYTPSTIYDSTLFPLAAQDQPRFDFESEPFSACPSSSFPLMHFEDSSNGWFINDQLTPQSATRSHHHRDSSLSSLGSAGPASPFTPTTSHPLILGDFYDGAADDHHPQPSQPLTSAQSASFLPYYNHQDFYDHLGAYNMSEDDLPKEQSAAAGMPAPAPSNVSEKPAMASVVGNGSSDAPSSPEETRKDSYLGTMPKLDRTMTDIYSDELYNPSFQITTAPAKSSQISSPVSPQNDVFSQRLQAANSQHLSANAQTPLAVPDRNRSPFRQGSPLAPSTNAFSSQLRFSTATQIRKQQKAENDVRVLQEQIARTSPHAGDCATISPKDVDLAYHDNDEDAAAPLFPVQDTQLSPNYLRTIKSEQSESELSEQSCRSMTTTKQDSTSSQLTSSQASQPRSSFSLASPTVPATIGQLPQHYPFIAKQNRQLSNNSNASDDFPATLRALESSNSEYMPDAGGVHKRSSTSANTGAYTCTFENCARRFDSPAKLQKHKQTHGKPATPTTTDPDEMTSPAQKLATQAGPYKCERINLSTGKPCNISFGRTYDLTRHQDTIHAGKRKVRCEICTEEKTFSRNDALTRHNRVCHPDVDFQGKNRQKGHVITR